MTEQEHIGVVAVGNSPFQDRVQPWMMACFGKMIAGDREERNHRFLEEALELVQSTGCTAHEAHQLVDYVYGREVGEPRQEVGGVMVTLAALCLANGLDMHDAAETELSRIWTKVEAIRAKQAAKPKHSPLPGPSAPQPAHGTSATERATPAPADHVLPPVVTGQMEIEADVTAAELGVNGQPLTLDELREEMRLAAASIRQWMPETLPANEAGQIHFARLLAESAAEGIEQFLAASEGSTDDR